MFRKFFITYIFVGAVVLAGYVGSFGQTAPVNGTVELQKADGSREPVAGALIEVYRTDIKAGFPSAKTNKKGEFSFAGMMFGATFVFSVSAPNCAPTIFPNVKAGQEKLLITLNPGDGRKFSEDEVRQGTAAASKSTGKETTELSAEQKKAQAEFEAKNKEITAKNEKVLKTNEIVARAIKEGNEAYLAKNYDLAIAKYDEGFVADPDFVGSAPIFLNNKGAALGSRAVETFNKTVKSTEVSEKVAGLASVKKDLADAANSFLRSWNISKAAQPADIVDRNSYESNKLSALRGVKDTFQKAVRTEQVDPALIDAAKVLVPEYLSVETDAAKKAEASLVFADLYRITEDRENAIAGYKKVLESFPDNVDALVFVGIVLVDLGWINNNDKAMSQEGANYLQRFVSIAPDTHKLKSGAVEYLNILKAQSIIPVKQAPAKKKP
jgi:tetratricopeptide (TPR) repeat protein